MNFIKGLLDNKSGSFKTKGTITHEEFVEVCDHLVAKCPSWSWHGSSKKRTNSSLPDDKQYLITKSVPCALRAAAMEKESGKEKEVDGWVDCDNGDSDVSKSLDDEEIPDMEMEQMHLEAVESKEDEIVVSGDQDEEIPDMDDIIEDTVDTTQNTSVGDDDDDEYACMDDFDEEDNLVEDDPSMLACGGCELENNIMSTRTYDISITYNTRYQTPHIFLFGKSADGNPLTPEEMFEDVMKDYVNRTVTVETHPHTGIPHASIHPCRHKNVMRRLVEQMEGNGKDVQLLDYLFIFLKFIQGVIPTVDFDFTGLKLSFKG
eukprot:TRINITY_DN780015_c0_g1_i1.p1 TRINITY_DN780015_c0_g1~~TRINITY_DN780015_c0_g1_i1.p1  ORF type:complete len:318 (-),score=111.76 TRINITY_DN780015_c0_g1_i1:276-1229(-)